MPTKTLLKAFIVLFLSFGIAGRAFSTTTIQDFDSNGQTDLQSISDFLNSQFTKSMGFYSTLGWNNPPGVYDLVAGPHFEIGVGVGADLIQVTSLNNLNLQALAGSANVNLPGVLPAPFPAATLRVGLANGLDIGLKLLYLPEIDLSDIGFSGNYTGFGVDFRYRILEGAQLPTLTVGVSWDEMQGSIGLNTTVNQSSSYTDSGTTYSASVSGTTSYALNWNVHSFGAKVVLGKDLMVVYPFIGVGFQRNSGSVVSTINPQLVTNVNGGNGAINTVVVSNGAPVVFEPKYVAGLDFGQGLHWALVGESNGSDIGVSTSFRIQF